MQKVVAVVLVTLALALGQIPSRTTINPLNGTVTGVITNIANDDNDIAPVLYSLWVPENAAAIEFAMTNTNDNDCYYLDLFLLSFGAPCVDQTFNIDGNAFCLMRTYSYSGGYEISSFITPGYTSSYLVARTGQYVYIGVGTENTYAGEACTYSLTAVVNTTCAAGQVAYATASDEWTCATPTRGNLNNFTQTVTNVSTTDYAATYYFPVAVGTATVTFNIQSTEYLYAYGGSNYGASEYRYDCYESSTYQTTDNYTMTLTCIYPETGYFSLWVGPYSPNNDFMNYQITTSVVVCNATTGGYGCAWDAHALDINNLNTINIGIPYVAPVSGVDRYTYFYVDVPANTTISNAVQVNVALGNTTGQEEAYVVYSKNTYPDYDHYIDSDQYDYITINDFTSWIVSFHDFVEAGRIWLGVNCYDGTVCNITITFTAIGPVTTTTTTTTGTATTTTGTATTVGTTTTGTATTVGTTTTGTATTVGTTTTATSATTTTGTSSNVTITTNSAVGVVASIALIMVAALF